DLDRGAVVDPATHGPLEDYRRRRFGGATTPWGRRLVRFDPIEFERRDHVPGSGWPFAIDALTPHFERAQALCEGGAYEYDAARALPGAGDHPKIPRLASPALK